MMPELLQLHGAAETLDDPYYRRVPLPRISGYRKLDQQARLADTNDMHVATNTWHARLKCLARLIPKLPGTTNYYARLQILHDPYW